jgi:hypothetical protein
MWHGALNLDNALNMDSSTDPSKPGFDMHLEVAKLKYTYLQFTQTISVSNIGTQNIQH